MYVLRKETKRRNSYQKTGGGSPMKISFSSLEEELLDFITPEAAGLENIPQGGIDLQEKSNYNFQELYSDDSIQIQNLQEQYFDDSVQIQNSQLKETKNVPLCTQLQCKDSTSSNDFKANICDNFNNMIILI